MAPLAKYWGGPGPPAPRIDAPALEQTRHVGVAKSDYPRLTNGEIIFEEFQPM